MAKKRIVYLCFLQGIPLWRRRQIAQDIACLTQYTPTERLSHIDRKWKGIQDFIQ